MSRNRDTSFYGQVLAAKEAATLERAHLLEGVDELLAVTHLALRDALRKVPRDLRLILKAAESASRLQLARQRLAGSGKTDDLIEAIARARGAFDDPNKDPPT